MADKKDIILAEEYDAYDEQQTFSESLGGYQALVLFVVLAIIALIVILNPVGDNPAAQRNGNQSAPATFVPAGLLDAQMNATATVDSMHDNATATVDAMNMEATATAEALVIEPTEAEAVATEEAEEMPQAEADAPESEATPDAAEQSA